MPKDLPCIVGFVIRFADLNMRYIGQEGSTWEISYACIEFALLGKLVGLVYRTDLHTCFVVKERIRLPNKRSQLFALET